MDLKLSSVLTIMIKGAQAAHILYDDSTVREQEAVCKNAMVKGRQLLFTIVAFFETNRQMEFVYTIKDLTTLPCLGQGSPPLSA